MRCSRQSPFHRLAIKGDLRSASRGGDRQGCAHKIAQRIRAVAKWTNDDGGSLDIQSELRPPVLAMLIVDADFFRRHVASPLMHGDDARFGAAVNPNAW